MSITDRAILMSLSISSWSNKKADKKVTQKALADANAKTKAGEFRKKLILSDVYDKYKNVESRARAYLEDVSFPFAGKMKIVPIVILDEVTANMREFRIECENLRDEFIDSGDYEASVRDAHNHLGSMFNQADYPDPETVRARFRFKCNTFPLPQAGHFVVDVEKETMADMQEDLIEHYEEVFTGCAVKILGKIKKQVTHMVERLEGEEKYLKWTLVKNMREFVALLPDLNINDDPEVDSLIADVRTELCKFSVEDLRSDPEKLKKTRTSAKSIDKKIDDHLKKMSAFMPADE